jgi:hypothetical protein
MPFGAVAGEALSAAAPAIAGGVASAGTSALLGSLLGGSGGGSIQPSQLSGSSGISALGPFSFTSDATNVISPAGGNINTSMGGLASNYLGLLSPQVFGADSEYQNLQNLVNPAFSDVTKARVDAITNAASKATSDLRGNLAQRRVLGSSFGQDALARVQLEAGQQEGAARAQGQLESIDAMSKLLSARVANMAGLVKAELDQANYSTSVGVNLINGTQQTFADNASILGTLAQANASGLGKAIAAPATAVGNAVTSAVNSYFTPSYPYTGGTTFTAAPDGVGFGGTY